MKRAIKSFVITHAKIEKPQSKAKPVNGAVLLKKMRVLRCPPGAMARGGFCHVAIEIGH